ncbi:MAG: hypothetical protein MUF73_04590 [Rhodobacteraceae bacterium]|jgi:hypothetical protein|nr:hypothetical protein [Paracoccaceae bacterium]
MIISTSRRFIFVHLHKCGGETIELAAAPHLSVNDLIIGAAPGAQPVWLTELLIERVTGLSKHASARDIRERLGKEYGWFHVFATVRQPDRRAHSLYSFCIGLVRQSAGLRGLLGAELVQTAPWPDLLAALWSRLGLTLSGAAAAQEARCLPPEGSFLLTEDIFSYLAVSAAILSPGFADFIRHPQTARDPGFASQWSMLSDADGTAIVDDIIRLETLDDAWPALATRFRLGPLPGRHNASNYAGVPEMTAQDRRVLRALYAEDFERLGYADQE